MHRGIGYTFQVVHSSIHICWVWLIMDISHQATMITKISFLLLFLAFEVAAKTSTPSMEMQTHVIYMDSAKIPHSYHSQGTTRHWYQEMIDSIAKLSSQGQQEATLPPQLLYVYDTVISGFAAKLSAKQLEALSKTNGFLTAIPDELLTLHTTHTPQFLGLELGKGLWNPPSWTMDVIIGVLDTGIWPEHVSFQDSGLSAIPSRWKGQCEKGTKFSPSHCNKKLIGARAFFKGYEALMGRINETTDYRSPRDSLGHGTHTASTAGGNLIEKASLFGLASGTAAGMKYTARISVYKVCWAFGCTNTDLLAAIDQAVADGVDVMSLSLGGTAKPFYADNVAIASFGAIQNGVFVSCSAGNSGPVTSSVDNTAPWIMTVGASYTDRSFPTTVKLGNGETFVGSSLYSGKATKQLELVYGVAAGGLGAKYCFNGSLKKKLVKHKIVVCERGINSRTEKGMQVKLAGGAGMILINTPSQGEELFADPHVLPAISLGASAGMAIKSYLNSTEKPTASISFGGATYGNPAPVMAGFSSRGPSSVGPEVIKPDVTAPGVNILAAWPPLTSPTMLKSDKRSVLFNIISGTSMSCPHVSGLAALLKSVHKDWSPAAIKSALMTTAYTMDNRKSPIADVGSNFLYGATPFAFGSGHVDPESASDPGLIYDITPEDYLNFLCNINYTSSQMALVARTNYSCPTKRKLHPGYLNYPSFAVNFNGNDPNNTMTHKRTVTNVGVPSSTYLVKVEEPEGVSVIVEPKSLTFRKLGEKLSYTVSFIGLAGKDTTSGSSSFGSITWASGKYSVRSPLAVTWQ